MSKSKIKSLPQRLWSTASRLFSPRTVHVCGLLGTYSIGDTPGADDDFWMATDFVALRQLIGAHDKRSLWLCGKPISRQRELLLGDPSCDRMVFDPPAFETLRETSPRLLAGEFTVAVARASGKLSAGDTLVVVLVGHGDSQNHAFVVGEGDGTDPQDYLFQKELLEFCVRDTKGEVALISTARYSGSWTSAHWTLLAATGPNEESPSISKSGSNECRGGLFTNALLAEYSSDFDVRPPYPGAIDHRGFHGRRRADDFGPDKTIEPSLQQPRRSIQEVVNWMHRFRDNIGGTYTSANIMCFPCKGGPHRHPFTSLISTTTPFHGLKCFPPSPGSNNTSIHSASTRPPVVSSPQNVAPRQLSVEEEAELKDLALDLVNHMPPSVGSERTVIHRSCRIVYGPARGQEPLSDAHRSELYSALKGRISKRKLALAIAGNLGWDKAVQDVGEPDLKQMQMSSMITLRRQAEASGCLVSILVIPITSLTGWGGAAGWLARVWEAVGRPIISPDNWATAVQRSLGALEGV